MANTQLRWDRFWFPAGSQISSSDGYLPDPEGELGPYLEARGVRLDALADIPCLILLGVPGMGKTSEMKAASVAAERADELVDFISLARLTGRAELNAQLVENEHYQTWRRGNKIWNIYLDGLDEALAQLVKSRRQFQTSSDNWRKEQITLIIFGCELAVAPLNGPKPSKRSCAGFGMLNK